MQADGSAAQTSGDSMIDAYRQEIATQTKRADALEDRLRRIRAFATQEPNDGTGALATRHTGFKWIVRMIDAELREAS